jgi:cytoskeletal protein CcmA (bactofilin family)
MKTKNKIAIIAMISISLGVKGQDLISGGSNSWKIHTPDDGRTRMYLGPIIDGAFRWDKGVCFDNNGKVSFNNNISVNGRLDVSGDIVSAGSNSWKIHTPDDGRTRMYIGPIINGAFRWDKGVYFDNNGKVSFNNNISVNGRLDVSGDIVSTGSNSWKIHTPDDGRTRMYLGPIINGAFRWEKGVYFDNNGKVSFNNNISVQGKIEAKEIKVTKTPTADFVFEKNYALPSLVFVEKHIKEKKHLPEIASAKEMKKNGINIGDFQIQLLQKIEELTLYTITQEKKLKAQNERIKSLEMQNYRIEKLEKENKTLQSLAERFTKIEKQLENKN